jgi:hypothetical protein
MILAAQSCVDHIRALLAAPEGLAKSLAEWAGPNGVTPLSVTNRQVVPANISADLAEKQARVRYPLFLVYCDRIENRLKEKFRRFSGALRLVVEVRVSSDRPERLQEELHAHTEAVLEVLEQNRGCLGDGLTWGGTYEVDFNPIRHGGANYLQSARITLALDLSRE